MTPANLLQQGIEAARQGHTNEAREILLQLVERDSRNELAWIWLAGLVDSLEDKIIACENVLIINPSNAKIRAYLRQLLREAGEARQAAPPQTAATHRGRTPPVDARPSNPRGASVLRELARLYEAEGLLEDALRVLSDEAAKTADRVAFDRIYREILRIEALQKERILHISPASTIARMTFGWPLLYLALSLLQVGLNPLAHPAWYLWLGLPIVIVGGFLLALSEVRSRHILWKLVFLDEDGVGSGMSRLTAAVGGWILVLLPHLLLLLDAWNRLQAWRVPHAPLTGGG